MRKPTVSCFVASSRALSRRDLAAAMASRVSFPGVLVSGGSWVVGDERCGASAARDRRGGLRWWALTGVVDRNLLVAAQTTEKLAVIGDGVVEAARNLYRLALHVLGHLKDVSFSLLYISGLAGNLDLSPGCALLVLAWNIDLHTKLLLELATSLTTTANEAGVLVGTDISDLSGLRLLLADKSLNSSADVVYNSLLAFDTNGVALSIGLRETNHARGGWILPTVSRVQSKENSVI
ncbi:hypothetical protein KC365_g48 [Hortaea werneckii]|nr:hypothetical protein KC339_g47 [Hortaea werneckii]KAI7245848.1 hypothetical protein KC365_g48 [Hortaea werneckii]